MFWFILLTLGILMFILLLPPWPYMRTRGWGYGPSAAAAGLVALMLILWWVGLIAFWWPWYTV